MSAGCRGPASSRDRGGRWCRRTPFFRLVAEIRLLHQLLDEKRPSQTLEWPSKSSSIISDTIADSKPRTRLVDYLHMLWGTKCSWGCRSPSVVVVDPPMRSSSVRA